MTKCEISLQARQKRSVRSFADPFVASSRSMMKPATSSTSGRRRLAASSLGLGAGSTFTITLPREQVTTVTPSNEGADVSPLRRRRVLIADDNRDSAESLGLLLSLEGHEVHVAYTGGEALALAVAQRPELATHSTSACPIWTGMISPAGCGRFHSTSARRWTRSPAGDAPMTYGKPWKPDSIIT